MRDILEKSSGRLHGTVTLTGLSYPTVFNPFYVMAITGAYLLCAWSPPRLQSSYVQLCEGHSSENCHFYSKEQWTYGPTYMRNDNYLHTL